MERFRETKDKRKDVQKEEVKNDVIKDILEGLFICGLFEGAFH
jgi:hypothetical protein